MVRYLLFAVAVYVVAVVETSLAEAWAVGPIAPDCLAVTALLWLASTRRPGCDLLIVGCVGVLQDAISASPLGSGGVAFLTAGYFLLSTRGGESRPGFGGCVARYAAAIVLAEGVSTAASFAFGSGGPPATAAVAYAAATACYTVGVCLPLLLLTHWSRRPCDADTSGWSQSS